MKNLNEVQKWVKEIYNDQILIILLKNSHLTEIQLETLLIDLLSKIISENGKKQSNICQYRIKKKISRGSFNRSLKQAQKNILKSIYTLLLIGYLNITDTSTVFLQSLEISNRLKDYVEMRKNISNLDKNNLENLKTIQTELEKILEEYTSAKFRIV